MKKQFSSNVMVGRKNEIEHLETIMKSREAEFVVVYGRRRVGKTFLVNTFFNDHYAFKLTGLAKNSKREQLANFTASLNRYGDGRKFTKPRTWYEAFEKLRELLESKRSGNNRAATKTKRVVFIDELPWLDSRGSNLVSALEHFWNNWAVTQKDLVLVVCGSATSWITRKILKNKGGLHNRVTQKLFIRPFTLAECRDYIRHQGIEMDDKEIAECYMIMGGIPYYLKNLRRGASLSQNVDEMFFAEHGRLDDEFDALYSSLFEKSDNYIKVVEALSTKNKGLTREEILKATKLEVNGHFSKVLKDLVDCDFVRYYKGYGSRTRLGIYQLIDPFTLFYFKFVKKYGHSDKPFWQYQIGTRTHDTWAGLAFEQLCLNHHQQIEKSLGISGIITQVYSWNTSSDAKDKAQIDMIIQRADKVINVCEMKYYDDYYTMKAKDYADITRRVKAFRDSRKMRCAIHPVLVTSYGLTHNKYSSFFQNVVTLKDLFH
ncbi:MAG: ATP-binding protein [Bacteroidales bacterium]|nr:ATP-binding protein [Bacteroidales bacterium]